MSRRAATILACAAALFGLGATLSPRSGTGRPADPIHVDVTPGAAIPVEPGDPTAGLVLIDWSSTMAENPFWECCSPTSCQGGGTATYKRWTRDALAQYGGLWITHGSSYVSHVPLAGAEGGWTNQVSSCVGFDFEGGSINAESERLFIRDVNQRAAAAGKAPPLWFLQRRIDLAVLVMVIASEEGLPPFPGAAVLRMGGFGSGLSRSWENFTGWFHGAGAGAQSRAACDSVPGGANDGLLCGWSNCFSPRSSNTTLDFWDAPASAGCQFVESFGYTLYTALNGRESGLGPKASYYFFGGNASSKIFYPAGVLMDVTDDTYIAWFVKWIQRNIERAGATGFEYVHKLHFFAIPSQGNYDVQAWPDMGDGAGGTATTFDGLIPNGIPFSGPKRKANGDDYDYTQEAIALAKSGRALRAAGVKYLAHVNPNWYAGCTGLTSVDATYTHASCPPGRFDDPSTPENERALIWEWVQNASYVTIELCGQPTSSIGCGGAGSGLSLEQLRTAILNPGPGVPAPLAAIARDTSKPYRTAPIVYGLPEVNPMPPIPIPFCGDGTIDADWPYGETCDDGNDDDGDGCSSTCQVEPGGP